MITLTREEAQEVLKALEYEGTSFPINRAHVATIVRAKFNNPKYDQTELELCEVCGWKTLIPDDCCLNCDMIKRRTSVRLSAPEIPNNLPISNLKEDELMYPMRPEPEPVAWRKKWEGETEWTYYWCDRYQGSEPLYTAPPRREWQSLTDEDLDDAYEAAYKSQSGAVVWSVTKYTEAIEAKLREKNNG